MSSIVFNHVSKRYSDGFEAVRDMSLSVSEGEFMILVGPSGSGKSTALRMVAGLEDITDGEIKIGNEVVNHLAPRDRDVAMVFQNYALYPHMTVRENMGFALKLARTPSDQIARKVDEVARILGLEDHLDRKPATLSGGQRQRVAMGRAIVRDPKALLMDEPLSNLDAKLRAQVRTEIARLHNRLGTTTVYVTHDQIEAVALADRIAVMRAGRIQQVGTPTDLYQRPNNLFVAGFIGSPAMNFLPGHFDGDRLHIPIGDVPVPDGLRGRLQSAKAGESERGVIVGIRPEHFQDASLVPDRTRGYAFKAKIDVLEELGSDYYAHFGVDSEQVASGELEELAQDAGSADLPRSSEGLQVVVRLAAASRVKQGEEAELWLDTAQLHLFDRESGRSLIAGDGAQPARLASATG